jgi:potassium efflux system protein
MIGLTVFIARLIRPKHGVLQNLIREHPHGWLNRLRNIWYPLVLAAPLGLIGLTLAGYTYTAGTLLASLVSELWLILGLVVLHQSIVRWLIVTRRRLALQAALDRRAARAASEEPAEGKAAAPQAPPDEGVDLASLDEQTRRLINALIFVAAVLGLWGIWSGVLPAFGVLDRVTLWHYTGVVDGAEKVMPFTLGGVGLILVVVVLATIAARNLPALLEILLLQRTSVSAGGRYTVKTMTGYLITAGAALVVFGVLGLSWGQVQWLVAALGVGIGFGLQEIVANFISGLIILFERPVRVGDIVTIGETTGTVTKIRIRATTIRNWDKQELLVPNKEFITGRLLNWTLSDPMNRVVITVGVDYGSDVRLAMRLLEEAVNEEERVLKDPAPLLSFEGFGDNSLTLVLRCYLGSMDYRIAVTTALHHAINDKFREHGISIAFPQRDVHLTTAQPLDVRVRQDQSQSDGKPAPTRDQPTSGPFPGRP